MTEKILIGIDPDVTKSGVAFKTKKEIRLSNLYFFELFEALARLRKENDKDKIQVFVECGYLNKGNWHKTQGSNSLNAQIGQRTGANHEVAKKIVEMCEYLDIESIPVKPTKSKVNADFFRQITKIETRTNQEQRDALMLIWGI
jgi:short-subunit dehydrogenase